MVQCALALRRVLSIQVNKGTGLIHASDKLPRRLNTIFAPTEHWKSYDVFSRQKLSTFRSSRAAVVELAEQINNIASNLATQNSSGAADEVEQAQQLLFEEMCEICLWGNATDLSLLTSLTYEDIQKLQGAEARKASKDKILVDDLKIAYDVLRKDTGAERRIDIVLDNAGFELYVDLILANYLLLSGLATHIVLHPKSIPWFVSDVVPADFASLLQILSQPKSFYETPSEEESSAVTKPDPVNDKMLNELQSIFQNLARYHGEGQLIIRPNRFWTHAGSFWRLPTVEPELWRDLQSSNLVIFKGDLNYRKLTGDVQWGPTTRFAEAIGPLGSNSGIRVLALRTCKADVVVGLPQGKDDELRKMEGGGGDSGAREWAWSGKWAVVQFWDGK